jgi:predicted RNA-binding Zn ribbon-like protein
MDDHTQAADLVIAFANTHADAGGRSERFADAAGVAGWWAEVAPDAPSIAVTDAGAAAVREIRDALVTVLLAHAGDPSLGAETIAAAEARLRQAASRSPIVAAVDRDGVRLEPAQDGVPGLLGHVLAATTRLALSGSWNRIKACRNAPCHLAFHDTTRNHSRVFCGATCSTQVGMRAYRKRRREQRRR